MHKTEETEAKILDVCVPSLQKKITSIGGREVQYGLTKIWWLDVDERNSDKHFDVESRSDAWGVVIKAAIEKHLEIGGKFKDNEIYFRIRQEKIGYEITLKYKLFDHDGIVTNNEVNWLFDECELSNVWQDIQLSGFKCIAEHERVRQSYIINQNNQDLRVDIDSWPGMPTYAEIEGSDCSLIISALKNLGLQQENLTTKLGVELFALYGLDFYSDMCFTSNDVNKFGKK